MVQIGYPFYLYWLVYPFKQLAVLHESGMYVVYVWAIYICNVVTFQKKLIHGSNWAPFLSLLACIPVQIAWFFTKDLIDAVLPESGMYVLYVCIVCMSNICMYTMYSKYFKKVLLL